MATGVIENVKQTTDEVRSALAERTRRMRSQVSPAGMALAAVGAAALAGVVVATIYYGPDFVRYLKIRRM